MYVYISCHPSYLKLGVEVHSNLYKLCLPKEWYSLPNKNIKQGCLERADTLMRAAQLYRVLIGKLLRIISNVSQWNQQFGDSKDECDIYIKIDLMETRIRLVEWIHLQFLEIKSKVATNASYR